MAITERRNRNMNHAERASQLVRTARDLGVLRYLLAYLDWDCGLLPSEVLEDLLGDLETQPTAWPHLHPLLREPTDLRRLCEEHRARASWEELHAEFVRWARGRYGLSDSLAWTSLIGAQNAVMPAAGRTYPETIELDHDVVAWYIARCRHGYECCALESQPAGHFVVRDPWGLSNAWNADRARNSTPTRWELDSPLAEARLHYQQEATAAYSQSA